jgi:hypothetical protein
MMKISDHQDDKTSRAFFMPKEREGALSCALSIATKPHSCLLFGDTLLLLLFVCFF